MVIAQLIDEDFVNYRQPAMFIGFPTCSFKCDKEAGCNICQNSQLANSVRYDVTVDELIARYIANPITTAVVCGGLEPLDSTDNLKQFMLDFRKVSKDDFVIYTGYKEQEAEALHLINFVIRNKLQRIIVKFGRFVPDQKGHIDPVLNVTLASENQYAKLIDIT